MLYMMESCGEGKSLIGRGLKGLKEGRTHISNKRVILRTGAMLIFSVSFQI